MRLEVIARRPESRTKRSPILFVHGFWHGAWCWEEHFLPYFAQCGYVCFAPNLRGHGGSEGAERLRWTSVADYVADVVGVAETLDRPPILIGHSMGGLIVQKYLQMRSAPAAVLLASVPPMGLLSTTLRFLVRHPLATLKAGLTLHVYPLVATPELYRSSFLSPGFPDEDLRRVHAQVQDDSFRAFLDMLLLDLPRPRKVKRTAMLVLGADDLIVRARQVAATARAYGVEPEVFPNMGHAMMLDTGWQGVAVRITEWLDEMGL
ncbi:MAG: alpha/beta fold hydrolase [Burkholderiales bacterium]